MTVSRYYTMGELRDLLAAKDEDLRRLTVEHDAIGSAWSHADVTGERAWANDFTKRLALYKSQRTFAGLDLDVAAVAPFGDSIDATSRYEDVLTSLNADWKTNGSAPGSLDDLAARIGAAYASLAVAPPEWGPLPQPKSDSGLNPTSWQGYLTGAAAKVGLVKDPPPGTPGTGNGAPPLIPTWLKWAGGGAAALFVAAQVKTLLR